VNDDGTPEPPPAPARAFHVAGMRGANTPSGTKWSATATITVLDANQNPVPAAVVLGKWSFGRAKRCETDATGSCSVTSDQYEAGSVGILSFTVRDIDRDGFAYDGDQNVDPSGNSDGTTISISRPAPVTFSIVDLDGAGLPNGDKWRAQVAARLTTANGAPVPGATIEGQLGHNNALIHCTTDANGTCALQSGDIDGNRVVTTTLTITSVTHPQPLLYQYVATANTDAEGDSTGTAITIVKP
jgi:hypothetical protein